VHLLCVDELLDTEVFHTQVKQLFQVIQKRHDGKALKELFETGHDFAELEPDTVQAIATVLERPGIWKDRERYLSREEGGKLNMCKGMDEWEAQAKSEGRAEGRSEGAELKCIEQTLKKLAKGKSPEEIADALEEELTTIEKICKAIEACGSECTAEKIRTQLVQM
ncbi:MAG: hypothetical protein IJ833_06545, partial [Lachnospiraceae bacterium]|nr:hypothetical protein [Lachnospiraceae bacterium]